MKYYLFKAISLLLPVLCYSQGSSLTESSSPDSSVLSVPGENLTPAALGVRTDRKGHAWNVERNGTLGRVGSTMVNSGLVLSINNQKFETFQPRMTRDAKEFVIHGRPMTDLAGIEVERRILFMEEIGALRYLEMFFNSSANPITLSVELATSFSGNYKTAVTDRAHIDPVLLGDGETGILVTPGSSQANRAFLFILCGPEAPDKPTISAQSRYGLKFQYQITLNPGETKALAHVVTQTITPSQFDRQSLSRLFKTYSLEKVRKTIPESFEDIITNRSIEHPRSDLLLSGDSIEALGVERTDTDVLAMGDQSRMFGEASLSPVEMNTGSGKIEIPVENISAIAGKNRGLRDSVRVFLKDGQIISGECPDGEVGFAMNGGGNTTLTFEKLDRLVMAAHEKATLKNDEAMIQTWAGDQIKLRGNDNLQFFGLTPWGDLPFTLNELSWLIPAPDDFPGYQVRLKDGTECLVYLSGRDLILNTGFEGEITLQTHLIRGILPVSMRSGSRSGTRVHLAADQWVHGDLREDQINVDSDGQKIQLKPNAIRRLTRLRYTDEDTVNHPFLIEMWDGSRIEGMLLADNINLDVNGQEWSVPLTDIVEIETSGPLLDKENRNKVAALITKLGDDSWTVREKATTDLETFGYLTIQILKREQNQNPDPEVRRRIDRVLNSFKRK